MFIKRLPAFVYHTPASVGEALELMAGHTGNCSYIAGGTDLLIAMKKREAAPVHLISLERRGLVEGHCPGRFGGAHRQPHDTRGNRAFRDYQERVSPAQGRSRRDGIDPGAEPRHYRRQPLQRRTLCRYCPSAHRPQRVGQARGTGRGTDRPCRGILHRAERIGPQNAGDSCRDLRSRSPDPARRDAT